MPDAIKTLGVLLFNQFELLDAAGPIEMFSHLPEKIKILTVSEKKGLVYSSQTLAVQAEFDFESCPDIDFLFVPGGLGTRTLVNHSSVIAWIKKQAEKAELILSVCTGAALLAKAGVLDHRKATTNKRAFNWVKQQGPKTEWIARARWVDDGNIITSSGVAAGTDMSLYVIERLYGKAVRHEIAHKTEYIFNEDPDADIFYTEK